MNINKLRASLNAKIEEAKKHVQLLEGLHAVLDVLEQPEELPAPPPAPAKPRRRRKPHDAGQWHDAPPPNVDAVPLEEPRPVPRKREPVPDPAPPRPITDDLPVRQRVKLYMSIHNMGTMDDFSTEVWSGDERDPDKVPDDMMAEVWDNILSFDPDAARDVVDVFAKQ